MGVCICSFPTQSIFLGKFNPTPSLPALGKSHWLAWQLSVQWRGSMELCWGCTPSSQHTGTALGGDPYCHPQRRTSLWIKHLSSLLYLFISLAWANNPLYHLGCLELGFLLLQHYRYWYSNCPFFSVFLCHFVIAQRDIDHLWQIIWFPCDNVAILQILLFQYLNS